MYKVVCEATLLCRRMQVMHLGNLGHGVCISNLG
jgi:hypothetical protein